MTVAGNERDMSRVVVVTGAAQGIGEAIATRFCRSGAHVVVADANSELGQRTAARIGGAFAPVDVTDTATVVALRDAVVARFGRIDVLVNNAGIADSAPLDRTTDEIWERAMMVNATAPFMLSRALAPAMVAAGWGRIVNVASNAGRTGYAYTSAYCASKHALVGLTRSLAVELARTGVTVNAVCPGWVKTDMASAAVANIAAKTKRSAEEAEATLAAMSPQRRLMEADEVACVTLALLEDGARGINGQAIPIDGGQVMA